MSVAPARNTVARQCRLDEFDYDGLPNPPLVILDINSTRIPAPTGDGKTAGHIGIIKHRTGNAYVSRKNRAEHRYRKGEGYAISKKILQRLIRESVHHLIWYEADRNRTLEFGIAEYVERGERVPDAPAGDPQVYVPDRMARHIWPSHDPILDARSPQRA